MNFGLAYSYYTINLMRSLLPVVACREAMAYLADRLGWTTMQRAREIPIIKYPRPKLEPFRILSAHFCRLSTLQWAQLRA